MSAAHADADWEEVGNIAHKLIPLFAMLGANSLVQHLRLLEKKDPDQSVSNKDQLVIEVIAQAQNLISEAGRMVT